MSSLRLSRAGQLTHALLENCQKRGGYSIDENLAFKNGSPEAAKYY
jgi:hypothetical protein